MKSVEKRCEDFEIVFPINRGKTAAEQNRKIPKKEGAFLGKKIVLIQAKFRPVKRSKKLSNLECSLYVIRGTNDEMLDCSAEERPCRTSIVNISRKIPAPAIKIGPNIAILRNMSSFRIPKIRR